MEKILLVTPSKKSADTLLGLLSDCGQRPERTILAGSCSEARRRLIEDSVDLIIINAPLSDEFGHEFAIHACRQSDAAGVLMLVRAELADSVSERVESSGVFVVTKPISRQLFYQGLHLIQASRMRIFALQKENRLLRQRLDDARIIGRAKCLLIAERRMSEPEAHAYIEKQAMNTRQTKREAAEEIVRSFA